MTFSSKQAFSNHDKQIALEMAKRIVELSHISKRDGMISLFEESKSDTPFLKMSINLLLEDLNIEKFERILKNSLLFNDDQGVDFLEKWLVIEGLVLIGLGQTPFVIANVMASIVGLQYLEELTHIFTSEFHPLRFLDEKFEPLETNSNFEHQILAVEKERLIALFREIDHFVLAIAFLGCTAGFIKGMKEYMTENKFISIAEALNNLSYEQGTIIQHQEVILNYLEKNKTLKSV